MSAGRNIATIARWEVKKTFSVMSRNILPVAIVLFVLLILVTGFAAESGLHIQDGMYRIGVDDPKVAAIFASDARFTVYQASDPELAGEQWGVRSCYNQRCHLRKPDGKGAVGGKRSRTGLCAVQKQRLRERERPLCRVPALDRYPVGGERAQLLCPPERPVYPGGARAGTAGTAGPRRKRPHTLTHARRHAGQSPAGTGHIVAGEHPGLPVHGCALPGAGRHGIVCDPGPALATSSLRFDHPRLCLHLPALLHLAIFHDEHHERADRTTG